MSRNPPPRPDAPGGSSSSVMAMIRLILSPRWVAWHLLTLGAMVTCGFLAAWQWHKAGTAMGSALNVGYGLQWPLFAVFFGVMWWRMLRMEIVRLGEEAPEGDAPELESPELESSEPVSSPAAAPRTSLPEGSSPFVHRHGGVRPVTDDDDPELAEYNRMLAALAARDNEIHH